MSYFQLLDALQKVYPNLQIPSTGQSEGDGSQLVQVESGQQQVLLTTDANNCQPEQIYYYPVEMDTDGPQPAIFVNSLDGSLVIQQPAVQQIITSDGQLIQPQQMHALHLQMPSHQGQQQVQTQSQTLSSNQAQIAQSQAQHSNQMTQLQGQSSNQSQMTESQAQTETTAVQHQQVQAVQTQSPNQMKQTIQVGQASQTPNRLKEAIQQPQAVMAHFQTQTPGQIQQQQVQLVQTQTPSLVKRTMQAAQSQTQPPNQMKQTVQPGQASQTQTPNRLKEATQQPQLVMAHFQTQTPGHQQAQAPNQRKHSMQLTQTPNKMTQQQIQYIFAPAPNQIGQQQLQMVQTQTPSPVKHMQIAQSQTHVPNQIKQTTQQQIQYVFASPQNQIGQQQVQMVQTQTPSQMKHSIQMTQSQMQQTKQQQNHIVSASSEQVGQPGQQSTKTMLMVQQEDSDECSSSPEKTSTTALNPTSNVHSQQQQKRNTPQLIAQEDLPHFLSPDQKVYIRHADGSFVQSQIAEVFEELQVRMEQMEHSTGANNSVARQPNAQTPRTFSQQSVRPRITQISQKPEKWNPKLRGQSPRTPQAPKQKKPKSTANTPASPQTPAVDCKQDAVNQIIEAVMAEVPPERRSNPSPLAKQQQASLKKSQQQTKAQKATATVKNSPVSSPKKTVKKSKVSNASMQHSGYVLQSPQAVLVHGKDCSKIVRLNPADLNSMSVTQLLQKAGVETTDAHVDMNSFMINSPSEIFNQGNKSIVTQITGIGQNLQRSSPRPTRPVILPVMNAQPQTQLVRASLPRPASPAVNTRSPTPPVTPSLPQQQHLNLIQQTMNLPKDQQQQLQQRVNIGMKVQQTQAQISDGGNQQQHIKVVTYPVGNKFLSSIHSKVQQKFQVQFQKPIEEVKGKNNCSPITTAGSQTVQQSQIVKVDDQPKYIEGYVAICPFCGISSIDFNRCLRCRRKLPETVKAQKFEPKTKFVPANFHAKTNGSEASQDIRGVELEKKKASPVKKKKVEEIILLESSDEEEPVDKKVAETNKPESIVKEPIYAPEDLLIKSTDLTIKEEDEDVYTVMMVKSCRIGNYKSELSPSRIVVSSNGIRVNVMSPDTGNTVNVCIRKDELKKVLLNYNRAEMFLYPVPQTAIRIRKLLGMTPTGIYYYDPPSEVQCYRRFIVTVEKMSEENKTVLFNALDESRLIELTSEEVDKITELALTSPPPPPPEQASCVILTFENLSITNSDYVCLSIEQYLNDVIIDFYLTYLCKRILSKEDRERTHFFSSFFYNRLTKKLDRRECSKESPAEKRHKRVQGWTKKVNLFQKDFIIIPINENSHWFLAIICFPGLAGPVGLEDGAPVLEELPRKAKPNPTKISQHQVTALQTVQIGDTTITQCKLQMDSETTPVKIEVARMPEGADSDRDEADGNEDELANDEEEDSDTKSSTQDSIPLLGPESVPSPATPKKTRKAAQVPIKQPCILIFDSLRGSASRARVVATLRDFLKIEYKAKMKTERDFNKDNFKGCVVKVPQQNNYTDCGLFLLQYVESFFTTPLTDFRLPIKNIEDWFSEDITRNKRGDIAGIIQSLMLEQNIDPRSVNLPELQFFIESGELDEADEEVDEEEEFYGSEEALMRSFPMEDEFCEDEDNIEDEEDEDLGEEEEFMEEDQEGELEEGEIKAEMLQKLEESRLPSNHWTPGEMRVIQNIIERSKATPASEETRQTLKSVRIQRTDRRIEVVPAKRAKQEEVESG